MEKKYICKDKHIPIVPYSNASFEIHVFYCIIVAKDVGFHGSC